MFSEFQTQAFLSTRGSKAEQIDVYKISIGGGKLDWCKLTACFASELVCPYKERC